ncbi:MAG: hypothetical protein Q7R69_01845 [bacterium]|nr:hypothetical protein [bacterium]
MYERETVVKDFDATREILLKIGPIENQIYRLKGLDDRNYTKLTFSEQIKRAENKF